MTANPITWEAYIMYDPETSQRIGIYGSGREAMEDCPGWAGEGYVIAPCEITLVKKFKSRRP